MRSSTARKVRLLGALLSVCGAAAWSGTARAQTTLFSDSFARTSGLGASWNVQQGSFSTNGTYAVSGPATPSGAGNWAAVVPALGTADYTVQSDIIVPSGTQYSGIFARSAGSDITSDLYAAQASAYDGTLNLYRRNGYTWTRLSYATPGIQANTRYTLMLVATGSSPVHLEVWLNGTRQFAFDDSSAGRITSGVPGMQNYDGNVEYGNFVVTSGGPTTAPSIASFSPPSGGRGDTVSISGTNLTGATSVTVGGVAATFAILSSSSIIAIVPSGAGTGAISVTTPGGTATSSATFTFAANANVLASNDANLPVGSFVGTDPDAGDTTIMTFAYEGGSRVSLTEVGSANHFIQGWNTKWTAAPTLNTPYRFSARLAAGSRTSATVQLQTYGAAWPASTFDLTTCTATDANGATHTAAAVSGQANTCDVTVTASFVSTTSSHNGASWNVAIITASGTAATGKALYVENVGLQPAGSIPITGTGGVYGASYVTWVTGGGPMPNWSQNPVVTSAKGDGVTDDTAQLQADLDTAYDNGVSPRVLVIPATGAFYRTTAPLQVRVSVAGISGMPTIRNVNADGAYGHDVIVIRAGATRWIYNLHVQGMFTGQGTPGVEQSADINFGAQSNVTVKNCLLENSIGDLINNDQAHIEVANGAANNVLVDNNTLTNPFRCGVALMSNANGWLVTNNVIGKSVNYVSGIDLEPDQDPNSGAISYVQNIEAGYNQFAMTSNPPLTTEGSDGKAVSMWTPLPDPGQNVYLHHNYGTFPLGFLNQGSGWTGAFVDASNVQGSSPPP